MKQILSRVALAALIVAAALTLIHPLFSAYASDSRINSVIWVNSWGAVAVYCADVNGVSGDYSTQGIRVLNQNGIPQLFAAPADIIAARDAANKTNSTIHIKTQGLYTLSVGPNIKFTLSSVPDSEGKTFLGSWTACFPVGNAAPAISTNVPTAVPTNTPTPTPKPIVIILN